MDRVISLFFFVFLIAFSDGLVVDEVKVLDVEVNKFAVIEDFTFLEGGFMNISVVVDDRFAVWLCRDSLSAGVKHEMFCSNDVIVGCDAIDVNGERFYMDADDEEYYLIVSNCEYDGGKVEILLDYVFMNPGGVHVSAGEEGNFWFYLSLGSLWGLLLFVWTFLIAFKWKYVTPFHGIMALVILIRTLFAGFLLWYWFNYYWFGGRVKLLSDIPKYIFVISEGLLIFLLYVLSTGWRIVRAGIPEDQTRKISLGLGAVVVMLCVFSIWDGMSMYYLLTVLILYFYIVPKIITNFSSVLFLLGVQVATMIELAPHHQNFRLLKNKFDILKRLRLATMAFIVIVLLVSIYRFAAGSTVQQPSEGSMWFLMLAFIVILRPRKHTFIIKMSDLLRLRQTEDYLINRQEIEEHAETSVQWDLSKTLLVEYPNHKMNIAFESVYAKENYV